MLFIGMGIAAALVGLILLVSTVNEYVIKPRTVLASVNGTDITRRDYWRYQGVQLIEQVNQYSRLAGLLPADQAGQYRQLAAQAQSDLDGLWGSTDTNDQALQQMVDDQIFLKYADDVGVTVTDGEVDQYILNRFSPEGVPLIPETPTPTYIPERAQAATETAAAAEPPTPAVVPTSGVLPPAPSLADAATDLSSASPIAVGATPEGSPETVVEASPAASPSISPTPDATQALETAEAGYSTYRDSVFERARISRDQYEEWVAEPQLVRQRVTDVLHADIGQRGEQVRAAHILVGTQELAQQLRAQLDVPGTSFSDLAASQSTDTASAANGGDLGWFTFGELVPPFEEAAFNLPPGQISQPVQTEFGWHIIRVDEHVQDRPYSDGQITALQERAVQRWLEEKSAQADIDSDVEPTATAVTSVFQPPAGAPEVPSPTVPLAPSPAAPAPTTAPLPGPPG